MDQHGKPQAVVMIMGIQAYIKTIAPAPDFLKELWAEAKRRGLNKMSRREINAEIVAHRQEKAQQPQKEACQMTMLFAVLSSDRAVPVRVSFPQAWCSVR